MKSVLEKIFNIVISPTCIFCVLGLLLVYVTLASATKSQLETAACYKVGMVKVRTDGGNFCVIPTNLVAMK